MTPFAAPSTPARKRYNSSLFKNVHARELHNENPAKFHRENTSSHNFVDCIQHSKTLEAHSGCVNSICWNRSGSFLASGSDDRHICLWAEDGRCVQKFMSDHANNIFSVAFLVEQQDRLIVSASADRSVLLHDLNHVSAGQPSHVQRWDCDNRVKRLAITGGFPKLFWSASEDGVLRQYDLRSNKVEKLVDLSETHQLKSLAVNEMYPEMIALAMNDSMVPIYDRRNTKSPVLRLLPVIYRFTKRKKEGNEIITNMGSENIYIFNVRDSECRSSSPDVLGALQDFLNEDPDLQAYQRTKNGRRDSLFHSIRSQAKFYLKQQEHTKSIDLLSTAMSVYWKKNKLSCTPFLPSSSTSVAKKLGRDKMAALRDFLRCLQICKDNKEAHSSLIKALIELKQFAMASACTRLYFSRFDDEIQTKDLKKQLEKAVEESSDSKNRTWNKEDYEKFCDYVDRFCGHYNFNTDIKEANWFGGKDEMIVGGSDCGSLFIWERASQKCHPNRIALATSGIDHVIRLWEPKTCELEDLEERDLSNRVYEITKENQQRTNASIWESLISASMGIDMLSNSIFEEFDWQRMGRIAQGKIPVRFAAELCNMCAKPPKHSSYCDYILRLIYLTGYNHL
uniref:Uncharacterized protein n=1 Tax=Ditylenchus dipsaci TaxID=166011 RepID=A0A915DFY4_9BILA